MTDFQASKDLVRRYYEELDSAQDGEINQVISKYTAEDYMWRGMHPFHVQHSADDVADVFWRPLRKSITSIQRREDVFMAGLNDPAIEHGIAGSEWVCSMGHMMGLFDETWLGIPSTGKMCFLRYVEFNRVDNGKIAETALFCDIIGVMQQAGLNPLPLQTGAALITPGPKTHDGLMFDSQDDVESKKTIDLINQMIKDLTTSYMKSPEEELARSWHTDMIWFGPAGIGATYTRERYQKQHQGPFRECLTDIKYNGHICRMAEGHFGGFFGWANLSMKAGGGFMGLPASDRPTEMRVVDIYRRDGDKLSENWIFIDLLHFLNLQNLDVLGRMQTITRS
jgi:hypothetical protein